MFQRLCALIVAVAVALLITSNTLQSAPADRPRPLPPFAAWRGVESFTAEASMQHYSWNHQNRADRFVEHTYIMSLNFKLDLKRRPSSSKDPMTLNWDLENCQAHGTVDSTSRGREGQQSGNSWYKGTINGATVKGGLFMMDLMTGKWDFSTGSSLQKPYREVGHSHVEWSKTRIDDGPIDREVTHFTPIAAVMGKLVDGQKPGVLAGTTVLNDGDPSYGTTRTYRVVMWPNYTDVACVVEIDKYEKWLPAANLALPNQPGSKLWVKATLKPKDGKPTLNVHARRFRFELVDTSHEPGVAMNYPRLGPKGDTPPATDPDPDLKLNLGLWSGTLSNHDQKALVDPLPSLDGKDVGRIAVDAFDFGGYASLLVVCELEDGREVPGLLKIDGRSTADITLPKRSDGSKIADSWRQKFKLGPNDAEDLDDDPLGDGNLGDGFSNYEEYRGFVVNGQHIRTLPNSKDLFIRNQIGAAAAPGIWLFRDITDLQVHYKLKASEMPESRIMNVNRSAQSPRSSLAPQHGLILVYGGQTGNSVTDIIDYKKAWRPGNVSTVQILRKLAPANGQQSAVLPEVMANELDATIAHELCHSIGVPHHGDSDIGRVTWVHSSVVAPNGQEIDYFEERRAVWDAAESKWGPSPVMGNLINIYSSPNFQIKPDSPGARFFLDNIVWVGVYGGQHSGSDQCIMRYDCAGAYVLPLRPRDRFMSPWEPPGMKLCRSFQGTGFNDPDAKPPRYSDAFRGVRGDCSHKFAVRDDAPDRNAPDPK